MIQHDFASWMLSVFPNLEPVKSKQNTLKPYAVYKQLSHKSISQCLTGVGTLWSWVVDIFIVSDSPAYCNEKENELIDLFPFVGVMGTTVIKFSKIVDAKDLEEDAYIGTDEVPYDRRITIMFHYIRS